MKTLTSDMIKERVIKGLKSVKMISSNYRSMFYQGALKNKGCIDFNNVIYFSDNKMNDDLSIKLDNYHVDADLVDVTINIESDLLNSPRIYDNLNGSYKCNFMYGEYKDLCIVHLTKDQIDTFASITKSNVLSFIKNIYVLDNDIICCTQQTITKVTDVNCMQGDMKDFKNGVPLSYSVLNILKQFALKGDNLIRIKYNEQTKHLQISMNTLPFSIYISYECVIGNSSYMHFDFNELIKRQQSKERFTKSYFFIKNAMKDLTNKTDIKQHNIMIDYDDQSVGLASSDDLYWNRVSNNCILIQCKYINLFKKLNYTDTRICENNIVLEGTNTMTMIMKLIK